MDWTSTLREEVKKDMETEDIQPLTKDFPTVKEESDFHDSEVDWTSNVRPEVKTEVKGEDSFPISQERTQDSWDVKEEPVNDDMRVDLTSHLRPDRGKKVKVDDTTAMPQELAEDVPETKMDSDGERDAESDIEVDEELLDSDSSSEDGEDSPADPPDEDDDGWTTSPSDIQTTPFDQPSGPRHNLSRPARPVEYFFLMFPLSLISAMVEETNRNARQMIEGPLRGSRSATIWYDTCLDEMRAFLAIQIMFGIRQMPRRSLYWSEDPRFHDPWVSSIMTLTRFKILSRFFHVRDTRMRPPQGHPNFDPLFKMRYMIETTQMTFHKYFTPNRELCVDRCIVGFKGLSLKHSLPKQPTKGGMKVWTLCESKSGYCLGYEVYTGRNSRKNPRTLVGFQVVDSLCSPYYNKGHCVYMDRILSSVDLANHLFNNGTHSCATICPSRTGLPTAIKQKMKTRGEMRQLKKGNVLATAFHNKRTWTLVSTQHTMGLSETKQPHPLVDFNKYMFMGGVDKFNHQLANYPTGRLEKKWWRYLLWHLISSSIFNAYILWSQSAKDYDVSKRYDHLMFLADVAQALANGFCSRKRVGRPATKQELVAPESIGHHELVKVEGRQKTCVLCSIEGRKTAKGYPKQTSYRCMFCKVALCKTNCFGQYHEAGITSVLQARENVHL